MILGFMKYLLKNLFLIFYKRQKCSIILNYHRIGRIDPENPFHRLHTVSFYVFKMQMRICRLIGKIVSLDDIKNSNLSSRISFSVTFDDVPYSSFGALKWLNDKKIPFAICPCEQITKEGIGWRDKVYFIEKFIKKEDLINKINQIYKEVDYSQDDSFYSLSKDPKFDQIKMINEVVNPLYERISNKARKFSKEKNYFNIDDLINLKRSFLLMEIVNHSSSHVNLTCLDNNQLGKEIEICDEFLEQGLQCHPKYIAVPFGQFNASLAVGLCEIARNTKKNAIFWVSNSINLDFGKKPNKVGQFCRFHTSTSVAGFCKQIIASFCRPSFIDEVTKRITTEISGHQILYNPNIKKILAFEDISRPYKDYSGCEIFFNNFYKNNPFLENSRHTIAEVKNERVLSIGQNLLIPFRGLGDKNLINFFGNWRGVSGSSQIGAAVILGKAIKEAEVLASYKPSKYIETTFIKMGWKPIIIRTFKYNLKKVASKKISSNFSIMHELHKSYRLDEFKTNDRNTIQIDLSRKLINWRVQNYQLANPIYFVWNKSESEKAFVIAQYNDNEILLLDQRFSSSDALINISEQIIIWCKDKKLLRIISETSCVKTQNIFKKCFPNATMENSTCYINLRSNRQKLKDKEFILTPLSSDVFLR